MKREIEHVAFFQAHRIIHIAQKYPEKCPGMLLRFGDHEGLFPYDYVYSKFIKMSSIILKT